ncbi:TetR/AcrR family transcriptional regulator [Aggregatibacter kilianii]|uniref:TetR/AcrR family transcriptional regulator n=1 Tax=Aggregatibacter kilianii TaxID=2025884 RepID=UPI000D648D50|nr:TetR/AcrR family transcriptional regulator [Aggregatibacter kilianii]
MKKDSVLKQAAITLFYEQGWIATSVAEICRLAGVSRVTFYKHFPTKETLVKTVFEEQKNKMRDEFERLLHEHADLATVIERILGMQQDAMATLYSAPVLADLKAHRNEELQRFFQQMAQEKYRFMHHFFGTLQQRKVIRDDFPIVLIDVLIQKIDEMLNTPMLQQHYVGNEQQLLKDVLQFFMHGIAYQDSGDNP